MSQPTENDSLSGGRPPPQQPQSDNQPQPASVPTGYGSIQTPYVTPNYTWYQDIQRNKPQSTSLTAASLICLSGGLGLSLSVGIGPIADYGTHTQYCWFIAVIIGACVSALLAKNVTKMAFNMTASLLVIIKGIMYTALAANTSWLIVARYCDGIAVGLTLIPAILAGSEQSVKYYRGRVLSFEQSSLVIGAMLMALFINGWKLATQSNLAHGITSIIYGLIALIFTFLTTIESPIFHLRKNNETEALNVIRQLQMPGTITNETHELLNESKALFEEDVSRGRVDNISNSWIPLIKIIMLRVIVTLSFSLPLTWGFLFVSALNDFPNDPNPFWFVFMRLLGVTISVWTIDRLGRKIVCAIGLLIGSIFLLGIGTLFSSSSAISDNTLSTIIAFLVIYQFLSGLVGPASTCYLSEAFSLSVKPYFILISIIVENIAQIIVCTQTRIDSTSNFAYVLAAFQFIFAFIFYFTMPETKQTTLREALAMFKRRVYINLGNA
ncbi:uncharacterized protein LOC129911083 [Episyrphus balteatus]|uniref:uncharacterized protein LOC129911083 n=1 Tax=Episyrphus balteatus TaxID=286459 RepID=UPI002486C80A|nr:uncharacterized protein LOC129911083 [Episyrphus balteatus]XP_055844719.1 uncharacterized protein LOC129911083 [Episyrphus balteatus]XP_055844720.1 uncharacterized protein LOC129911083 [Episyrphus balteatus]XP_055844721.1 uncharacterized protein LOC129911083 [Episyrphus balteatus]